MVRRPAVLARQRCGIGSILAAPRHHDEGVASLGAVAEGGLVVPRVVVVVAGDNLTRDEVQGGDERRVRGVAREYLDIA